jgi:hypothetical protein
VQSAIPLRAWIQKIYRQVLIRKSENNDRYLFFSIFNFFFLVIYITLCVGIAYQGKDIVFRFIIEYSSLRDFGPKLLGLFLYEDFWKMIF